MMDPHYKGVDQRNRPYTITAAWATQATPTRVDLGDPKGDLVLESGNWLQVEAREGVFIQRSELLDLSHDVVMYRDDGTVLRTQTAAVDIKQGAATSNDMTPCRRSIRRAGLTRLRFDGQSRHRPIPGSGQAGPQRSHQVIRPFAAALFLAVTLATVAHAQGNGLDMSKGGPIEVTSRDGIEWRQNEQVVIARGDARAVRGDVTVMADTLTARYRRKAGVAAAPAPIPVSTDSVISGGDTGANEIYRLEADGHVKIFNPTDIAVGDHAVYDIDQAVLVMTGKTMSLTTPNHVMTARDTMEWWSQKHMAVGRGLATVTTADGKRLAADVLVGYTAPDNAPPATTPSPAAKPAGSSAAAAAGKLQKVEAFGHVEVRTATETITGDRGVYVADTEISPHRRPCPHHPRHEPAQW